MNGVLEIVAPSAAAGAAFPPDVPRRAAERRSAALSVNVEPSLHAAVAAFAGSTETAVPELLHAVFAALLHRYTGEPVVLDYDFSGDPPLSALLRGADATAARAGGEPGPRPIAADAADGVALRASVDDRRTALLWDYDAGLFAPGSVERLALYYQRLLAGAVADPDRPVSRLPLMTPDERATVIAIGRGASRGYERDASIPALFARRAQSTPDAVAVVADGARLTYADLDRRSNQLAQYLRSGGIGNGAAVGIAMERSADLPVALLGVLKAGATYVPLDVAFPAERLGFMIDDANVAAIVGDARSLARMPAADVRVIALDAAAAAIATQPPEPPVVDISSEAIAYVAYTSGSTGRAKGVAVTHRGAVRLVRNTDYLTIAPDDVFLQCAAVAFDASTFEIWAPLLNGAKLAIPRPGLFSDAELGDAITAFGVTTLFLTTMVFQRIAESRPPGFAGLRRLLTGGEAMSPAHARGFIAAYPACRLIHCYGPTENTTFSTTYDVPSADAVGDNLSIGRAIANSTAYVLDRHLEPVPVGVPGELCVGGDGVARGYLGLAELTAEKFVRDPFAGDAPARLYRSGDRVRLRPDGLLEFLGRTDNQVKIRGFRIELEEVEAALVACDMVREAAVVVVHATNEKMMVAYVIAAGPAPLDEAALRAFLSAKVPAFMIPHRLVGLNRLPESATGKIDRVALARAAEALVAGQPPPPTNVRPPPAASAPAPGATAQTAVGELWREVLRLDAVPGLDVNFFDAGGDSLLLLKLHGRLQERFPVKIGVMDLFQYTTIRTLSAYVAR